MAMASACCSSVVRYSLNPVQCPASVTVEKEAAERVTLAQPAIPELPKMHSVTIIDRKNHSTHEFSAREDQYILEAAKDAGLSLPFSCRQGNVVASSCLNSRGSLTGCCTACAVRIRSGQLYQPEAMGLASVLKTKGYGLLCVGYALSDIELETQDEDEVYFIQFGRYHGQGTIIKDDYALDLIMGE